ncbi:hypothetical protein F2P81_013083 [Scophthalmus maximus]|uniref:Uncharacterized protein n=1 Tax=Scophthalmus maximus TaxID=52904 RepID=A0A6A4SRX2_SCOMX|nr:hypothetical protein F2P81_013083 [Scophthalmus maximus]
MRGFDLLFSHSLTDVDDASSARGRLLSGAASCNSPMTCAGSNYSASELWEIDEFARQQLDLEQAQPQQQTHSATSSPINLLSPDPDEIPEVYELNQKQQDGPVVTEVDQQRWISRGSKPPCQWLSCFPNRQTRQP